MSEHLPILIVTVPLAAAFLLPLVALGSGRLAAGVAHLALAFSTLLAGMALARSLDAGTIRYTLGGWAPPWGIEYVVDPLAGGMALLVAVFGLISGVYAGPFAKSLPDQGRGGFYALYLLLVAGLLGIVLTGDLFNLYVFMEISSLAAYALIAQGGRASLVASFRYLLLGTIAGAFYLLGVGYIYGLTGTLNMADAAVRLAPLDGSPAIMAAAALIVVGLGIKMALFPLHGWLPDAYTHAPAPVTAFIAAVMTKVSAYVILRFLLFVLPPGGTAGDVLWLLGWIAAVAAPAGSLMALAQSDVRRMLAYSSIGHMGYIVLGIAIGTPLALTGALLHTLNHAVMKSCLFLSAGGVAFRTRATDIAGYGGMAKRLPLSMAAFSLAALSMVGIPPTAGFFSKWYLLRATLEQGAWPFALALVLSSLLGAVYFFRVIERAYLSDASDIPSPQHTGRLEVPAGMLMPTVILAAAVLLLGLFNDTIVTHVIAVALPARAGQ
jgi:multicomponent Na+:H+ antiporter subunit D